MSSDYSTRLNKVLVDNKYPLPNIESVLVTLNKNRFFNQLDLRDTYFQIATKEDRNVTTVVPLVGRHGFCRDLNRKIADHQRTTSL